LIVLVYIIGHCLAWAKARARARARWGWWANVEASTVEIAIAGWW
jgi:hypothetical protein